MSYASGPVELRPAGGGAMRGRGRRWCGGGGGRRGGRVQGGGGGWVRGGGVVGRALFS